MKAKVRETKKSKLPHPENKEALEKVKETKKAIEAYFKKNRLDPEKDYSKDKVHGPVLSKLMAVLEVNRKKMKDSTAAEIPHKKSEDPKKEKKPVAEKVKKLPKDSRKVTKYDYPLVDGREMTSEEKKKYRIKMRKEAGGTKKSKTEKVAPVKEKKVKKESKVEKTVKVKKAVKGKDKKKKKND